MRAGEKQPLRGLFDMRSSHNNEQFPRDTQERVFKDVRSALEQYPYLRPEPSEIVNPEHGNTESGLSLCGPIQVYHSGIPFFVPVDLFISTVYPAIPPTCHVRPAKGNNTS